VTGAEQVDERDVLTPIETLGHAKRFAGIVVGNSV
jgi:hypothetical protein